MKGCFMQSKIAQELKVEWMIFFSLSLSLTHARMHARTHVRTHACIHIPFIKDSTSVFHIYTHEIILTASVEIIDLYF